MHLALQHTEAATKATQQKFTIISVIKQSSSLFQYTCIDTQGTQNKMQIKLLL